jgi:hypothetical protein
MKIEHILKISGAILVVYHTDSECYQYSIAFWDGLIHQPQEMYETADKAANRL